MSPKSSRQNQNGISRELSMKNKEIQSLTSRLQSSQARIDELERELKDYQEQSKCYESALEETCDASEEKIANLQFENSKLTQDLEKARNKLNLNNDATSFLQAEILELITANDQLSKALRKLEEDNDKFEREIRELKVAKEEMERECNVALEKIALLGTELEEFEDLKIEFQRFKDENAESYRQYQASLNGTPKHGDSCVIVGYTRKSNSCSSMDEATEIEDHSEELSKEVPLVTVHNQTKVEEAEPQVADNNKTEDKQSKTEMITENGDTQDSTKESRDQAKGLTNKCETKLQKSRRWLSSLSFTDKKQYEDENRDKDKRPTIGSLLRRFRNSTLKRNN